jgi:hypothetical protein
MATKDITDKEVVQACLDRQNSNKDLGFVTEILNKRTGQPIKVCESAMQRSLKRELIDYGVSLRTAFPTEKGLQLLEEE